MTSYLNSKIITSVFIILLFGWIAGKQFLGDNPVISACIIFMGLIPLSFLNQKLRKEEGKSYSYAATIIMTALLTIFECCQLVNQ